MQLKLVFSHCSAQFCREGGIAPDIEGKLLGITDETATLDAFSLLHRATGVFHKI